LCHMALAPSTSLALLPLLPSIAPSAEGKQWKYESTSEISERKTALYLRKVAFPNPCTYELLSLFWCMELILTFEPDPEVTLCIPWLWKITRSRDPKMCDYYYSLLRGKHVRPVTKFNTFGT
jgi:hypothetical protein